MLKSRFMTPRPAVRDVKVVITNSSGQELRLWMMDVVSVHQEPANVFSEHIQIEDSGDVVYEHESGTLIGTFCENLPGERPFQIVAPSRWRRTWIARWFTRWRQRRAARRVSVPPAHGTRASGTAS